MKLEYQRPMIYYTWRGERFTVYILLSFDAFMWIHLAQPIKFYCFDSSSATATTAAAATTTKWGHQGLGLLGNGTERVRVAQGGQQQQGPEQGSAGIAHNDDRKFGVP